jgi:uncharacterized ion transporter superfamily protein YfcC
MAWPRGLKATASIVFYIFLIGGTFGVINATGAVDAAISAVVRAGRGRGPWVLTVLFLAFSVGGGTIGMAEETLPFIPALVLLARRMGYDDVTGCAIALVGAGAGFSGAFLNPFTVGWDRGSPACPVFRHGLPAGLVDGDHRPRDGVRVALRQARAPRSGDGPSMRPRTSR